MNEQTLEQKLDIMYNLTKQVNLKYDEHAILQQYYQELKNYFKQEGSKKEIKNTVEDVN